MGKIYLCFCFSDLSDLTNVIDTHYITELKHSHYFDDIVDGWMRLS